MHLNDGAGGEPDGVCVFRARAVLRAAGDDRIMSFGEEPCRPRNSAEVLDYDRQAVSNLRGRGREQCLEAGAPPALRRKTDRRLQII